MDIKKTRHTLPREATEMLEKLTTDPRSRNDYIAALRAAGWTLSSIGDVTFLSRERIRQIAAEGDATSYAVPLPPPPKKKREPKVYNEPDPASLARLLELQDAAKKVRANAKRYRGEAEEFMRIIWHEHNDRGVPLYRLAKRLDLTTGAVRSRLIRYGYITPKSGSSRAYDLIKPENRA